MTTAVRLRRLACAVAVVLASLAPAAAAADVVGSSTVRVDGLFAQPSTFTVADLKAMPGREVVLDAAGPRPRRYRGVALRDLLVACRPIETGRFDLRQSYVVARATDGYLAVFSWTELLDSPMGDGVLVAVALDDQPLAANEGPLALVSALDTRSGPRHVRWLVSIDLRRATP